jgi:hypothetical protein
VTHFATAPIKKPVAGKPPTLWWLDAESPAAALEAISRCILTDSLMVLAQDPLRLAEDRPIYPEVIAEALQAFGDDARRAARAARRARSHHGRVTPTGTIRNWIWEGRIARPADMISVDCAGDGHRFHGELRLSDADRRYPRHGSG